MLYKWNNPPGWPTPPEGWLPPKGWSPPKAWPNPPWDWQYFVKNPDAETEVSLPEPEWLTSDYVKNLNKKVDPIPENIHGYEEQPNIPSEQFWNPPSANLFLYDDHKPNVPLLILVMIVASIITLVILVLVGVYGVIKTPIGMVGRGRVTLANGKKVRCLNTPSNIIEHITPTLKPNITFSDSAWANYPNPPPNQKTGFLIAKVQPENQIAIWTVGIVEGDTIMMPVNREAVIVDKRYNVKDWDNAALAKQLEPWVSKMNAEKCVA